MVSPQPPPCPLALVAGRWAVWTSNVPGTPTPVGGLTGHRGVSVFHATALGLFYFCLFTCCSCCPRKPWPPAASPQPQPHHSTTALNVQCTLGPTALPRPEPQAEVTDSRVQSMGFLSVSVVIAQAYDLRPTTQNIDSTQDNVHQCARGSRLAASLKA